MKRILFSAIVCFILIQMSGFSQEKNVIFRENFPSENLQKIEITTNIENIKTSIYNGQEIIVEISTNQKKLMPKIKITEEKLKITNHQKQKDYSKGDNCNINLYLPYDFQLEEYKITTFSGEISIENLKITDTLEISSKNSNINLKNLEAGFLNINTTTSITQIQQLTADFFTITQQNGLLNLELKASPLAKSTCTTQNAPITLYIPKNQTAEILARTKKSQFINNHTKTTHTPKDWLSFFTNPSQDAPQIYLQTEDSKITLD